MFLQFLVSWNIFNLLVEYVIEETNFSRFYRWMVPFPAHVQIIYWLRIIYIYIQRIYFKQYYPMKIILSVFSRFETTTCGVYLCANRVCPLASRYIYISQKVNLFGKVSRNDDKALILDRMMQHSKGLMDSRLWEANLVVVGSSSGGGAVMKQYCNMEACRSCWWIDDVQNCTTTNHPISSYSGDDFILSIIVCFVVCTSILS